MTDARNASETDVGRVVGLRHYPVKSMGGQKSTELRIEPWGPVGDRRWAVIDPGGKLKTARSVPGLLRLRARATGSELELARPDGQTVVISVSDAAATVKVSISRLGQASDMGDAAARFLSDFTNRDLRLVYQPDPRQRSVNPANGGAPGETLSLADAGPLLITSRASLRRLQTLIGTTPTIPMERFRPNVILDEVPPFDEDRWSGVRLGEVDFRVQQLCDRCTMTTIDPSTGDRGEEPLRTLNLYRANEGTGTFGIRVVPLSEGSIRLGDVVHAT